MHRMGLMRRILLTGFVLIGLSMSVEAKSFRIPFERQLDTAGVTTLDLTWIDGDCEITTSDSDQICITAVKRLDALTAEDASDMADHILIQIDKLKGHLVVGTRFLRTFEKSPSFWQKVLGHGTEESFGAVDWKIMLPAGINVNLTSASGAISASQCRSNLTIKSSAADIALSSIEGAIDVDNGSGRFTGELLIGPISIRQMLGSIDLQFVEGDIRIKSSSANITVNQEKGALDLKTTTGNVDIQTTLESSRDYLVTTGSGHIRLSIPQASSGRLKVNSQTGEIKTDIPVAIKSMTSTRLEGVFGDGGVRIALSSMSGDVTVAQF